MTDEPFFRVRQGGPEDHGFIVDSWRGSFRRSTTGTDHGPNYVVEQKSLVHRILGRSTTEVRVACSFEDKDAIHAYAVIEPSATLPRIYYVYVRNSSRKLGMAKQLLLDLTRRTCIFTHKPELSCVDVMRKVPRWCYSYFANFEDAPLGSFYSEMGYIRGLQGETTAHPKA